jgi:hypothetical protein
VCLTSLGRDDRRSTPPPPNVCPSTLGPRRTIAGNERLHLHITVTVRVLERRLQSCNCLIISCNFRISISHTVSRGCDTWYDQQATRYIQVYISIPAPLFFNTPTSYFLNCTSSFSKSVMPRRLLPLSLYAIVIL